MNTQSNQPKPTLVSAIAWMTLVSGVVNLFWGFAATATALVTIIGIVCTPITILPTILGVFELIYAAKLLSNPAQPVKPSTLIAVFEIACVLLGNIFAMAVGVLALVFYNDTVVRDYFARLNGIIPPAPASLPEPSPTPVMEESAEPEAEEEQPEPETPAPEAEEKPAKPKRAPRKVAKK